MKRRYLQNNNSFLHFLFILLFGLSLLLVGCKHVPSSICEEQIRVRLIIQSIPGDSVIFLTGNSEKLGNWNARGLAIHMTDGSGEVDICADKGDNLQFKLTAGSWSKEAIYKESKVPSNWELQVANDTTVQLKIIKWRDELALIRTGMTGNFDAFEKMKHPGILDRNVTVWLPPDYGESNDRYPVLYMHDGQNVFNPNSSTLGVDWGADEWADSLIGENKIKPIIIVAINCTDERFADYSPGKKGSTYMDFITNNLKPKMDSIYRTKSSREHTAVLGASMGGLISFMLHWDHNDIFGKAACLSPAFVFRGYNYPKDVVMLEKETKHLELFMSNGTEGLDKQLQLGCDEMIKTLTALDYSFHWKLDQGADHNEIAWNKMMGEILIWMFGENQ